MSNIVYVITRDTKVFNPVTKETEEVSAGDVIEHAHLWQNFRGLVNSGLLVAQSSDEAPAPEDEDEAVASVPVEEQLPEDESEDEPEDDETLYCGECDFTTTSERGLSTHQTRMHSGDDEDE